MTRHLDRALLEADDLSALREDLPGVLFAETPYEQPDNCSECPELDPNGPAPSTLLVVFERYGRIHRDPTCGRLCTNQKVRDLRASVRPPAFIHVLVIRKHMIDIVEAEEAA